MSAGDAVHAPDSDDPSPVNMPDYTFARRPKWIAGHMIAIAAVLAFVLAGLWQVSRLSDRRAFNTTVAARSQGAPIPLPSMATASDRTSDLEWQLVEFEATWTGDEELLLQAQSLGGLSGHDVLTPADVEGLTVVVDRGWVPIDVAGPPVEVAIPVANRVTVRGVLRTSQVRGTFGPTDPSAGPLGRVSRVDLPRIAPQLSGPVYPMWVQLLEQDPAQGEFPRIRPLPDLGEGPHLGYAVQWFLFAGIVVVAYPILIRSTARPSRRPSA